MRLLSTATGGEVSCARRMSVAALALAFVLLPFPNACLSTCVKAFAEPESATAPDQSRRELPRELERVVVAMSGQAQAFARELADAELATVGAGANGLTQHEIGLLTRTVAFFAAQSAPYPEERAFRVGFTKWVTGRLLKDPVTAADTDKLKQQIASLGDRMFSIAEETFPAQAADFQKGDLAQTIRILNEAAGSLLAGGPMHPVAPAELDEVVAAFAPPLRSAVPPDPMARLVAGRSAALVQLYKFAIHGGLDMPEPLKASYQVWLAAEARRSDKRRQQDIGAFNEAIAREEMTPDATRYAISAGVASATALWHAQWAAVSQITSGGRTTASATSNVAVYFRDNDQRSYHCTGQIRWSAADGGTTELKLSSQDLPDGWLSSFWDGAALSLSDTSTTFRIGSATCQVGARARDLPVDIPPLVKLTPGGFAAAIAAETAASRVFWNSVLPRLRAGQPSASVDLSAIYQPGLRPLWWQAQPRASRAQTESGAVVLLSAEGRTVARTALGATADTHGPAPAPLAITVRMSASRVRAVAFVASKVAGQAVRNETLSALLPLPAGSIIARFDLPDGGPSPLAEFRVLWDDDSEMCVVKFTDYQITPH